MSLLQRFDSDEAEHIVVTLREAGPLAGALPDHVGCRPLDCRGRSPWAWLQLAKVLREYRARIVHARNPHSWKDALAATRFAPGCELVLGFHGLEHDGPFDARQRRLMRLARLTRARFTSVSRSGADKLVYEGRVPPQRISVLHNGVDRRRFRPMDHACRSRVRDQLGIDPNTTIGAIVGSLVPVKGHEILFQALTRFRTSLPHLRLLIIGDGPLEPALQQHVAQAGIEKRVKFLGRRHSVADWLPALDFYVCASHSEGMSNAVLEAMSCGLPVIATEVGDNGYVVRHDIDGLVVPPRNAPALARAIETIVRDADKRNEMGQSARERSADFTIDQAAHLYERYYQSLLPKPSRPLQRTGNDLDPVVGHDRQGWSGRRYARPINELGPVLGPAALSLEDGKGSAASNECTWKGLAAAGDQNPARERGF